MILLRRVISFLHLFRYLWTRADLCIRIDLLLACAFVLLNMLVNPRVITMHLSSNMMEIYDRIGIGRTAIGRLVEIKVTVDSAPSTKSVVHTMNNVVAFF